MEYDCSFLYWQLMTFYAHTPVVLACTARLKKVIRILITLETDLCPSTPLTNIRQLKNLRMPSLLTALTCAFLTWFKVLDCENQLVMLFFKRRLTSRVALRVKMLPIITHINVNNRSPGWQKWLTRCQTTQSARGVASCWL